MISVAYKDLIDIYLILMAASAGVIFHSGLKTPYFAFFHHDSGHRPQEAPVNMLIAMGIASVFCVLMGVLPGQFYQILPYALDYQPYDTSSVLSHLQLMIFALLAFAIMARYGFYLRETNATVLNSDWFYRKLAPWVMIPMIKSGFAIAKMLETTMVTSAQTIFRMTKDLSNHPISGPVIPGPAAIVQVILLAMILVVVYAALG